MLHIVEILSLGRQGSVYPVYLIPPLLLAWPRKGQGISSHGINPVILKYHIFSIRRIIKQRPEQNEWHFENDVFQCTVFCFNFALKLDPKDPVVINQHFNPLAHWTYNRKHKDRFSFSISYPKLSWQRKLKSFLVEEKDLTLLHNQCYDNRWWSEAAMRHGISSYDINLVRPDYFGFNHK